MAISKIEEITLKSLIKEEVEILVRIDYTLKDGRKIQLMTNATPIRYDVTEKGYTVKLVTRQPRQTLRQVLSENATHIGIGNMLDLLEIESDKYNVVLDDTINE